MFILNPDEFEDFNLEVAGKFIDFWSQYYENEIREFGGDEVIVYLDELNIGNELTTQNVKKLLRWKDYHRLTEIKLSVPDKGKENLKVTKVIRYLDDINDFRLGNIDEDGFQKVTMEIFPDRFIWRIFLFHIAKPFAYPIGDQHVFRAYRKHREQQKPKTFDEYKQGYIKYFFEICRNAGIIEDISDGNEDDIRNIISQMKRVDNALFEFGKFLNMYDK